MKCERRRLGTTSNHTQLESAGVYNIKGQQLLVVGRDKRVRPSATLGVMPDSVHRAILRRSAAFRIS
jgi:hypothetical protein